MDEIQSQIDSITDRLDENDSSLSDFSDNLDSQFSDLQSTIDDQTTSIDSLNETQGQLTFPLSQDTIDLINEQFQSGLGTYIANGAGGTVTLVAGSATVISPLVSTNSLIMLTRVAPGGTIDHLSYTATAGQVVIHSNNSLDTSTVAYIILN